jgi:hypothetical protein
MQSKIYTIEGSRSGQLLWLMPEPLYLKNGDEILVSPKYADVFERQNKPYIKYLDSIDDIPTKGWLVNSYLGSKLSEVEDEELSENVDVVGIQSLASNRSMTDKKKKRKGRK